MGSDTASPPPLISRSLQARLLVAVGVLALATVAAVALAARHEMHLEFRKLRDHELRQASDRLKTRAEGAASLLGGGCCAAGAMSRAAARLAPDEALVVTDDRGALIAVAGPAAPDLQAVRTRMDDGTLKIETARTRGGLAGRMTLRLRGPLGARVTTTDGRSANLHIVPVPRGDGVEPAALFLGSVDRRLLAVAALVGVLALALTWTIARRIVRPIAELGDAARDLAGGNLSRRVDASGSDEIAALARGFNTMAAELERQQMLRRHLVQDVAHELRTPLTALQCRLETMVDGLAADPRQTLVGATEEVRHLSRLLDDLQEIATAESRELKLSIGDVSIAEVARSAIRAAGLEGDARLRLDVAEGLTARGDAIRVRQVLLNLLTNADRHTPPDGEITVRASHAGRVVVVDVRNTGSTLTPDHLDRIFDRFYRGDPARQRTTGGTGLGLTIVKHLVETQGGRVSAASDAASVTITFTLPAHAS